MENGQTTQVVLHGELIEARVIDLDNIPKYKPRWYEGKCLKIVYWPRHWVYIMTWKYGLQFDVQRDYRKSDQSFKGHLWTWDVRKPKGFAKD
jgi:hypothetical protein